MILKILIHLQKSMSLFEGLSIFSVHVTIQKNKKGSGDVSFEATTGCWSGFPQTHDGSIEQLYISPTVASFFQVSF